MKKIGILDNKRTKTDEELKEILKTYNDNELAGLMFGLLPANKTPPLSGKDTARLMEMNPKGHY